ncbi:MAG: hypothetical protein ABFC91_07645 [Methanobacteriaceae archaeon]
MSKKKKKEEVPVIISLPMDGSLPVLSKPHIVVKKRKKKKYNVQHELDNTRLDMIQ